MLPVDFFRFTEFLPINTYETEYPFSRSCFPAPVNNLIKHTTHCTVGSSLSSLQVCLLILVLLVSSHATEVIAQDQSAAPTESSDLVNLQVTRLDELSRLLEKKIVQRDALRQTLAGVPDTEMLKERETLADTLRDIAKLQATFELIALGDTDTSLLSSDDEVETDWRQDLIEIMDPLVESLKSLTKRPRQLAELRDTIFKSQSGLAVADQALAELGVIPNAGLDDAAADRLAELAVKWQDEKEQLQQELLVSQSQLERLTADQESFVEGILPATRAFLLGRGLTVVFAAVSAVLAWCLMRLIWWVYTTHFTTKEQRRNKTWFRLLEYSFYLLTTIFIIVVVLCVLYIREDLLLLALALLLLFGAVLSFRQFLPRYIREARLLLNLGSVREDERVVYNGLPWQVMSLNLHSVLRNPALDGVIRLPLDMVGTLVSRPVKNNLWFPSNKDDYVILPDGVLGQIRHQTPDLVEISVRGGMSMTYNTSDFYSINLVNLSRDKTFGVSITFGFDYTLQAISLTEIPEALEHEVNATLVSAGYKKELQFLLVELSEANASSLDFLVFASFKSQVASDYYRLLRLLQQACVAVSNDKGWTIPFPQLTVHQSND